jgi:hypothetical protein
MVGEEVTVVVLPGGGEGTDGQGPTNSHGEGRGWKAGQAVSERESARAHWRDRYWVGPGWQ